MVSHQYVCLGACIDAQSAARAPDFVAQLGFDMFERARDVTGNSVSELRRICVGHQIELVRESIGQSSGASRELVQLGERLFSLLQSWVEQ